MRSLRFVAALAISAQAVFAQQTGWSQLPVAR